MIDFLSLLGLLSPAEQYLISALDQSMQRLHDEIEYLRETHGRAAQDKIAVIQAEINYTRVIQTDFLTDVISQPSQAGRRRRND
jgi:hypothetical protein